MTSIVHLLDDGGLGGVTRTVETVVANLKTLSPGDDAQHRIEIVNALTLPPPVLTADIIVVHLTANWAKLPFLAMLRARNLRTPLILVEHSYTEHYERRLVPSKPRCSPTKTTER